MAAPLFPFTVDVGGRHFTFHRPPGRKLAQRIDANPDDPQLLYRVCAVMLGSRAQAGLAQPLSVAFSAGREVNCPRVLASWPSVVPVHTLTTCVVVKLGCHLQSGPPIGD
jgi:hypothetical protein